MVMVMELPEDLLADVLRRLLPHGLAAARCVHSSWRAIIDTRRLMHLLPLRLAGILITFNGNHHLTELFARPSPAPVSVSSKFHHYMPAGAGYAYAAIVTGHCNGLLLLEGGYVVNPATRQWAKLPSPRPPCRYGEENFWYHEYIVFDPAVSPHYEVLVVPEGSYPWGTMDRTVAGWEWPPSSMLVQAFSSRTNRWEERSFQRQGEPFSTIADQPLFGEPKTAVYWRGHLYVHHYYFMRISLSSGKYQVIKPPQDINPGQLQLGRSEKGVYLASIAYPGERLQSEQQEARQTTGGTRYYFKGPIEYCLLCLFGTCYVLFKILSPCLKWTWNCVKFWTPISATFLVYWLIYRPDRFHPHAGTTVLAAFDLTDGATTLQYDLAVDLSFRNSHHLSIRYLDVAASLFYNGTRLGPTDDPLPSFIQRRKNTTVLHPAFHGAVTVDSGVAAELQRECAAGTVHLRITVSLTLVYKVLFVKDVFFYEYDCWLWFPPPRKTPRRHSSTGTTPCAGAFDALPFLFVCLFVIVIWLSSWCVISSS
ncbi:uncharacterized protein LOC123428936 [Hordeum vulgare subsp. vulgare]|uniref:uncharacterized protein LOC123428936 n=1 Tax=Hordeum vulgare subsp. vulgare TaxID=112509 RepID=UPI001D1A50C0|nr:uncharacterized protein LOC123428936 [Hordeum vulgare subsp. vulgare]